MRESRPCRASFATWFILIGFLLHLSPWALPNQLLYAIGIPMGTEYLFMMLAAAALVLPLAPREHPNAGGFEYTVIVLAVLMLVLGLINGNEGKLFIADICDYSALLLGMLWVRQIGRRRAVDVLTWIYPGLLVLAVASLAAAKLGVVEVNARGVALPQYGQFFLLAFLAPIVAANRSCLAVAGALLSLVASAFGATRSASITALASIVLVGVVWLKPQRAGAAISIIFLVAVTIGLAVGWDVGFPDVPVVARFESTELTFPAIRRESRYGELEDLWKHLVANEEVLWGSGFGAVMYPRWRRGVGYSRATHVGVATFLLKGGILALAACVIFPLVSVLLRLVSQRRSVLAQALYASTLIFFIQGTMSGGWQWMALFLYGSTYAAANLELSEDRGELPPCHTRERMADQQ